VTGKGWQACTRGAVITLGSGHPQDYGELEQSVAAVLAERGLQQSPAFLNKAAQLWDTLCVRFGVMLVGPTGGGKSACWAALQGALTRLRSEPNHPNEHFQVCVGCRGWEKS
jgi:dynein heavy chain